MLGRPAGGVAFQASRVARACSLRCAGFPVAKCLVLGTVRNPADCLRTNESYLGDAALT